RAAPIAGDVHRRGDKAGVVESLVHGGRAGGEMLLVHVVDRVGDRLRDAGGAQRRERGPVLDDALLASMPPDEMRNVVDIRTGAGRDRRQADRRQGWEYRRAP